MSGRDDHDAGQGKRGKTINIGQRDTRRRLDKPDGTKDPATGRRRGKITGRESDPGGGKRGRGRQT